MENASKKLPPVLDYPSADPSGRWLIDTDPLLAPQTWWTHIAFALLVLVLLWELRFPLGLSDLQLICVLGIALGTLYWGIRLALLLILSILKRPQPHPLREHWRRWLIIPLLLCGIAWSITSQWPSRFVFGWHRDEMQRVAEQVLAGQSPVSAPRRVGMYRFDRIGRTADGSSVAFYESRGSWGVWFYYTPGRADGDMGGPWSVETHD